MYFGGLEPKAYIPIKDKKGKSRFILNKYLTSPTPGSNCKNIDFLVQSAVVIQKSRKEIGLDVKW